MKVSEKIIFLARNHISLIIFLVVLTIYISSLNGVWATDHPSSFVQLDWSIWSKHSFAVNDSQTGNAVYSMDDFPLNGQWYIAAPPGLSFFSLPFVILAFILDGYTPFGYVLIFSEAFVALMGAIAVFLLYKISRMFFREKTSIFLAFALAFSTLLWPFATYYFQHDVSTAFVLLTFYFALKTSISEKPAPLLFTLCGLAMGAALLVDYVNAILIPIIAVFLLFRAKNRLWGILSFFCGSMLGIVTILAYNLAAFGNVFTTSQNMYDHKALIGDFTTPLSQGLFMNFLSPYRGIFVYCPLLVLGPLGLYLMLRHRSNRAYALLMLLILLSIVIPYSMWQDVTAGVSFGPRFIIPAIPFLLLPVGQVIERSKFSRNVAFILYGLGVVFNGSAAMVSVIHPNFSTAPSWTTQIIGFMIGSLTSGSLDVWWQSSTGAYWWLPALALIAVPVTIPIILYLIPAHGRRANMVELHEPVPTITRVLETNQEQK